MLGGCDYKMRLHLIISLILSVLSSNFVTHAKVVDFDAKVRAFAYRIARERNRNLKWYDAYGKHEHLRTRPQYRQYKVSATYDNIVYKTVSRNVARPEVVYTQWFHNGGEVPIIGKFSKTKSVTSSFTWSFTESLKIGTSAKLSVGVPGVLGADLTVSTELQLSSTQAKTTTSSDSFTVANDIPVPAGKSVKVVFSVVEREVEVPWEAWVRISGWTATWLDPKWNGHWLYFWLVRYMADNELKQYGNGLTYKTQGKFTGVRGVETVLTVQSTDYHPNNPEREDMKWDGPPKVVHHKIWH